ncbi:MAG: exosortase C-terminal domain/associated protein EpsI [bacterium]
MKRNPPSPLAIVLVTAVAAALVYSVSMSEGVRNPRFFEFPLTVGDWKGIDLPMHDRVYESIDTPYVFLRNYESPRYSMPLNLSIVWFDDKNISFHAPEACLGGVGHEVKEKTTLSVGLGDRRSWRIGRLRVEKSGAKSIALYFFDVDGYLTTSQTIIRLKVLSRRLLLKRSSASFVRVMAPVVEDEEQTLRMMLDFLRTIHPLLPPYTHTDYVQNTL